MFHITLNKDSLFIIEYNQNIDRYPKYLCEYNFSVNKEYLLKTMNIIHFHFSKEHEHRAIIFLFPGHFTFI